MKKAPYFYFSHNGFNPGCVMEYTGVVSLASFAVCESINILTFIELLSVSPRKVSQMLMELDGCIFGPQLLSVTVRVPLSLYRRSLKNSDRLSRIHDHVFGGYRIGIIYG